MKISDLANSVLCSISHMRSGKRQYSNSALELELKKFQQLARNRNYKETDISDSLYLLCCATDEAFNLAEGDSLRYRSNILNNFFSDANGGAGFFEKLDTFLQSPLLHIENIELCLLVLSSGFVGKYAMVENSHEKLCQIRSQLHTLLKDNGSQNDTVPPPRMEKNNEGNDSHFFKDLLIISLIATLSIYIFYEYSLLSSMGDLRMGLSQLGNLLTGMS